MFVAVKLRQQLGGKKTPVVAVQIGWQGLHTCKQQNRIAVGAAGNEFAVVKPHPVME